MINTRVKIVIGFFILFWLIILVRIYYLSIKSNTYYEAISKRNAIKTEYLIPQRGLIYDKNDKPLAINELGFAIALSPGLSKKSKEKLLNDELDLLISLFPAFDKEVLKKKYLRLDSPYEHEKIQIVDFIKYDDAIKHFTTINLSNALLIYPISKRYYPYGSLGSHVIGYIGKSNEEENAQDSIVKLVGYTGKTGIEKYYNDILKGNEGEQITKVTALNEEIEVLSRRPAKSQNIKLSIDIELQKYISEIFEGKSGSVIVMDLEDGSILSAISFPEYDLNKFVTGISHEEWNAMAEDFNHPFTNKLVNGLYPPGSVVKMSMALAFLNSGVVTPQKVIYCPPYIEVSGRVFRDWKKEGHGEVDMRRALKVSSDVYFYKLALESGIDTITPVIEKHGFGVKTGVDLPNEFIGIAPGREWKRNKYGESWYLGETVNTVIGQGYFLATSMQVARNTAMIATGKDIIPHFIHSIDKEEIKFTTSDTIFNQKEKNGLSTIRAGMYDVCNDIKGTAYWHTKGKIKIACKTGTAQVVGIPQEEKVRMKESELEYYQRSHAWFTSYGPHKNPKYSVTVLVEHGGGGGVAGGPIASKIYNKLYEMGYIKELE